MKCAACDSDNGATRKFCRACGAALATTCQQCGATNEPGDRFCGECGTALVAVAPAPETATAASSQPDRPADYLSSEERRPVTILFADIAGFTSLSERLDAEDVRDLTTECFRRLVTEATALGGMVDKFIGDAVMVLFGAPTAHEDDPARATRAALAMQRALDLFNTEVEPRRGFRLALRIGIESGEVVTGLRDVNGVREYTAIGDAVNVAARLQSATEPGTIMVGPNTERHIRRQMALTPVQPLHLKGKAEPIPAWLVQEDSAKSTSERDHSSPFVGRADEMTTFLDRLADLRRGRGQVLAIIGDPGLGKSRLVSEARAASSDLTWWRATALAHQESSSHAVTRSVLAQLCTQMGTAQASPDELVLSRSDALGFADKRSLIARVLGLASLATETADSDISAAEAAQLGLAVVQKLLEEATNNRPSVLEIDDLHWADPSSAQLLMDLLTVTERTPVMLCLMFRPERDAPIWQLREHVARYLPHRYTEINLHPLTSEAARELASRLLGASELPDSVNTLLDRAAGTPLWLEELIRTLQERGVVVSSGEQDVVDLEHLEIPDTLHGLIVARLDRLGEARVAVQTASVIGRQFAYRVLSRIADDGTLDHHLVQAQRADLVRELAAIPEREYGFKHVLVQEATYSTLLLRRRRELHRLVAEVLSELYADRLETLQPTLAFHYERAEEWDRALEHTVAAAEAARAAFANREALTHFTCAINLLGHAPRPPETRMRLLRRRAEVANDLGDFDASRADLEAARALAAELNDAAAEAQIVGALAMLWSGHRDYEEGLRLAETAVQIASHANAPRELAQAHVRVATALLNLNREASSRDHLESALGIFRSLNDEDGEAHTLDLLGMASFVFGHTQAALEYSQKAMLRLRATGDRWTEASSAIVHGISAAFLGDLTSGLESVQYALTAWTEMDSVSGISFAHSCLAEIGEPYGEFQLAFDHVTEGLHIAQSIEHLEWQCMGHWQFGRLYRACGLLEDSERHLREHIRVATSLQATLWIAMGYSELGCTLSESAKLEEGSSLLRRALELGTGIDMGTFSASIEMARLALDRGEFQRAYDLADHVMSNARGLEVWALDIADVAGRALCGLGRSDEGTQILRSALERATAWQAQPARWRLHLGLSRVLANQGRVEESRQEAESALGLLQATTSRITDQRLRDGLQSSVVMQEAVSLSERT